MTYDPNLDETDFLVNLTFVQASTRWSETVVVRDHREFEYLKQAVAEGSEFHGHYFSFSAEADARPVLVSVTKPAPLTDDFRRWAGTEKPWPRYGPLCHYHGNT